MLILGRSGEVQRTRIALGEIPERTSTAAVDRTFAEESIRRNLIGL